MKINELLMSIHRKDFNIEKELQVKNYLPIEEKKLIAQGIIYECTEETNGVIKVDSVQQYLSYVKYMILRHTNLEYKAEDYDKLCSTKYNGKILLDVIMECFNSDAKECLKILNLMVSDRMKEASIEFTIAKFLSNITNLLEQWSEKLEQKVDNIDLKSMIPEDMDMNKLNALLTTYIK